jgi:hypothetical protein
MAVPGGLSNPSLTPVPFPAGAILQVVQLSGIYPDSKTFPDKPTVYNASVTNEAFEALPENATVGDIENFVETYFVSDGVECTSVYNDPELITLSLLSLDYSEARDWKSHRPRSRTLPRLLLSLTT